MRKKNRNMDMKIFVEKDEGKASNINIFRTDNFNQYDWKNDPSGKTILIENRIVCKIEVIKRLPLL